MKFVTMKQRIRIILISILSLGTFIVISSFILLNLREINDGANNDTKCLKQESTSQPLTSPVDFPGFYSNIASNQNPVVDEFATLLSNVVVIHDADTTEPRMIACNPPFMVMGLYDPNVPLSPSNENTPNFKLTAAGEGGVKKPEIGMFCGFATLIAEIPLNMVRLRNGNVGSL